MKWCSTYAFAVKLTVWCARTHLATFRTTKSSRCFTCYVVGKVEDKKTKIEYFDPITFGVAFFLASICIYKGLNKRNWIERQIKYTLNSRKFNNRQISYTPIIIHLLISYNQTCTFGTMWPPNHVTNFYINCI